jgi:RNA polymerase sigma-70 factor, ECF subfamily
MTAMAGRRATNTFQTIEEPAEGDGLLRGPRSARSRPEGDDFIHATQAFRRELLAHCYRMLGSVDEAQDAVQETYLRAWRAYGRFEGRSSVRVWLYRIATNVCLTALERRSRRVLPSGLGAASQDPDGETTAAGPEVRWLEPMADALVAPQTEDPSTIAAVNASLRLALTASLQLLPARQRAVLILRDGLDLPAAEVAQMLDTTTVAVKSALQRARARVEEAAPQADELIEPSEPQARALLDRYMAAFEEGDLAALEQILRDDATLEMTATRTWFAGKRNCLRFINRFLGSPDLYRMHPTSANGQPSAAAYRRAEDGTYEAFALVVLTATTTGIARIALFNDPRTFANFGLPPTRPAGTSRSHHDTTS